MPRADFPNLRKVRQDLLKVLDKLPSVPPPNLAWHPTYKVSTEVYNHLAAAMDALNEYLNSRERG